MRMMPPTSLFAEQPDFTADMPSYSPMAIPLLFSELWVEGDDEEREMIKRDLWFSKIESDAYWADVYKRWNSLY